MIARFRFVLVFAALLGALVLAGCNVGDVEFEESTVPVTNTTVEEVLRFVDMDEVGPEYIVRMTLPEDWVGDFQMRVSGNRLFLDLVIDEDTTANIFFLEALSEAQYWEQIGSYPGTFFNVRNTADTYFTYYVPVFAFYTGLTEEEFETYTSEVPAIVQSFSSERIGPDYFGR